MGERLGDNGSGNGAAQTRWDEAVRALIVKRAQTLAQNHSTILKGEDAEALHAMRVASRRLRAALDVVGPFAQRRIVQRLRRELKHTTRTLGATREADVLCATLTRVRDAAGGTLERAAAEHALDAIDRRRNKARKRMRRRLEALDGRRLRRALRDLSEALDLPRGAAAETFALELVQRRVAEVLEPLPWLRENQDGSGLHALRIAIKKLRYALELLAPLLPASLAEWLPRARLLQELLGHYNDDAVCERVLLELLDGLVRRNRTNLADGLLGLIEQIRATRNDHYAQFVTAAGGLAADALNPSQPSANGANQAPPGGRLGAPAESPIR